MIHSDKNLHRLNILANSDYSGKVDGILREGRYYPLAINRTITARRAFRGMAGLAVSYPSVVDYIGQAVKDALSALYGDLRGYSVNLCR